MVYSYTPQVGYVINIIIGLVLIIIIYFVAKLLNSRKEKKEDALLINNIEKTEQETESKSL